MKKIIRGVLVCLMAGALITAAFTGCGKKDTAADNGQAKKDTATTATENANWSFDNNSGVLTIDVEGKMDDYSDKNPAPWSQHANDIKSVKFTKNITSIGDWAFYNCTAISNITIPETVTAIGSSAFFGCDSLTTVALPEKVDEVGGYAFGNCQKLTAVNANANSKSFTTVDGVLYDKDKETLVLFPAGKADTEFTVPKTVETIGDYAFGYCKNLTKITIYDSVTYLGIMAFAMCENLETVSFGTGVDTVAYDPFFGCDKLVIKVKAGSYMENYAKKNSIVYETK